MDRSLVNALAEDLFAVYQDRAINPETRAPYRIDLRHYTDLRQFELERKLLFHDGPLMMGFSGDLPEVGSVKTNDCLDIPILMVRTETRRVAAFANMCRHRSARLVSETACFEQRKSLTCRFHGWVYGLDGELKHVSQPHLFGPMDLKSHGLIELPCEERHGMIFVLPKVGGALLVDAHLGEKLSNELSSWKFENMQLVDRATFDTPSNWKLQLDSFLESYHVEALHAATIGPLALSGYFLRKSYGPHQRTIFAQATLKTFHDLPPEDRNGHKHLSIVYHLFPNINITYGPRWVHYSEIYPGKTIDSQRTRFSLYSRKPLMTEEHKKAARDYFQISLDFVRDEDYLMGQEVTRSVMSGVEQFQIFGHAEEALVHYHQAVRSAIGLDPGALFYDRA